MANVIGMTEIALSAVEQVEARLWNALREVEDPEIPISVVGMGLIVSLAYRPAERAVDIELTFTVRFPEGEAGDKARAILPRAIAMSHDRICTVSQTVQRGTPITVQEA